MAKYAKLNVQMSRLDVQMLLKTTAFDDYLEATPNYECISLDGGRGVFE